jgi:hypothetical protein
MRAGIDPTKVGLWAAVLAVSLFFWAPAFALVASATAAPYEPPELPGGVTEPGQPEGLAACQGYAGNYEGEDEAVAELRLLRNTNRLTCLASTQRLDLLEARLWWLVAEAVEAHAQRVTTNEKLTSLVGASTEPIVVTAEGALPVEDAELLAASGGLSESVDASGEAVKSGVYLVAGILAGLVIALMLWQTWRRVA